MEFCYGCQAWSSEVPAPEEAEEEESAQPEAGSEGDPGMVWNYPMVLLLVPSGKST